MDENLLNKIAYFGEIIENGIKYRYKDYYYVGEVRRLVNGSWVLVARHDNKTNKWEVL